MPTNKRKVLLIGWDAADWKIIDQLMASGLMPALKSLVERGVRGRLATLDPPLSPMLWTSMATGVRPFKHGVLGFVEHDGHGSVRPVSSHSRKVKAIWNMLSMEGYKSNVVGWWPSNPVESINGCMVSNLFHQEKKDGSVMDKEQWPVPDGSIFPERIKEKIMDLRVHPQDITGNLVLPFVPQAWALDKKEDKRLLIISRFLAHASTVHGVCTELMETEDWDFMAVYHDAIDHFSHGFMKYHPPKMEGLDEESYHLFKDVVKGAYVFHDMMLERLLKMIDGDTTVMLISDHGFHSDHLRPRYVPNVPSGPAVEHAPYGVFVAAGPGIKKGEHIFGARVLDITPTLLSLYDLPIGKDMDGRVLVDIYDHPKEISFIESWENDSREGGSLVCEDIPDQGAAASALQQLVDLGYINDPEAEIDTEEKKNNYLKNVLRENNFYLAKSYANGGKYDEALELLLEIESKEKPDFRYLLEIISCAIKTRRFSLANEYIDYIRKNELIASSYMDMIEARVQLGLNDPVKARIALEKVYDAHPEAPDVLFEMGKMMIIIRELEKAKACFLQSLKIDPDNPYACHGFGLAALRNEEYELALDYFLQAIEKLYHYPQAHFHLGECLVLMKEYEAAVHSFEVVANIAPELPKTYRWLQDIYEILGNDDRASMYRKIAEKFRLGEKVIVTGLPSQMLEDIVNRIGLSGVDLVRFEEETKDMALDEPIVKWLAEQPAHVVEIPMKFIGRLTARMDYTILFVQVSPEESADFVRLKAGGKEDNYDTEWVLALEKQLHSVLTYFSQQPNLDIIYLNHLEQLEDPMVKNLLDKLH